MLLNLEGNVGDLEAVLGQCRIDRLLDQFQQTPSLVLVERIIELGQRLRLRVVKLVELITNQLCYFDLG